MNPDISIFIPLWRFKDNIQSNESYYIVEIKSLKRIVDAASKADAPVLCFIDGAPGN